MNENNKLTEIKTSYGVLYVEHIDKRDEYERIKIYDSNMNYLDYRTCYCISAKIVYNALIKDIQNAKNVEDLLDNVLFTEYFSISTSVLTICNLLNSMCGVNDYKTEADILTNEWVNKVGDSFIIIKEN